MYLRFHPGPHGLRDLEVLTGTCLVTVLRMSQTVPILSSNSHRLGAPFSGISTLRSDFSTALSYSNLTVKKLLWVLSPSLYPGLPIQRHLFWSIKRKIIDAFIEEVVEDSRFPLHSWVSTTFNMYRYPEFFGLNSHQGSFCIFFSHLMYRCLPFSSKLLEFILLSLLFKSRN